MHITSEESVAAALQRRFVNHVSSFMRVSKDHGNPVFDTAHELSWTKFRENENHEVKSYTFNSVASLQPRNDGNI